ncbi:MAG TPA: hypothetical protein PK402_02350 [Tepidisphaeraceae bacterium]|nr:hypothetical protein [Tepidisphaeraceae bacterium]
MTDLFRRTFGPLALIGLLALSSCQVIGLIAYKMPQPPIMAEYRLAGQPVSVMVWADQGIELDWPSISRDLAGGLTENLKQAVVAENEAVLGVTFPVAVESVVRWQKDNPGYDGLPITSVAPQLGTSRVIYVEINKFSTRTAQTFVLYRGSVNASIKVIEVENGVGKVAWEKRDINVFYPDKGPEDGTPKGTDYQFYVGTMTELATQLAELLIDHPPEEQ